MKKIFIILSVLSLFVGCTSKPKNDDEYIVQDTKWETGRYGIEKYDFNHRENYESEIFKDLFEIINQPIITKEELKYIADLPYGNTRVYTFDPIDVSKMPISKSDRINFTGRIINLTEETVKFYIPTDDPHIYKILNIPAGETGYFTSIRYGTNEFGRVFYVEINGKLKTLIYFNEDEFHNPNTGMNETAIYLPICEEIMKTHSLELIYDGYHEFGMTEYKIAGDCEYDFKFIEPFDYNWEN